MPIDHYENFPVASVLLPRHLRGPVTMIYRFARSADDFADEGNAKPAERLAALDAYRGQLLRLRDGQAPESGVQEKLFVDLGRVIREFELDIDLFLDLLSAFSQDVTQSRYRDFAEVLDYSRRSANPVGRLMLGLYRANTPANCQMADHICSSLQLINFWQDVAIDLEKDRVYLPAEDLARFGLSVDQLRGAANSRAFAELLHFELERARQMMHAGAPLVRQLRGRIGLELRLVVQGGLRIAEKIEAVGYDVFGRRPILNSRDWPLLAWRGIWMRP